MHRHALRRALGAPLFSPSTILRWTILASTLTAPLLARQPDASAAPVTAPSASAPKAPPAGSVSSAAPVASAASAASAVAPSPAPAASASTPPAAASTATTSEPAKPAASANDDPTIPGTLSIDAALKIFRERGYDLLVADAAVLGAEGDEIASGAVANPSLFGGVSKVFTYAPGSVCVGTTGCSSFGFSVGVSDNGALMDVFVGKRPLRLKVARGALAIARVVKEDTRRVLELQLKTSLAQLAAAQEAIDLAKEVAIAQNQTYEISKTKYPRVINEGDLSRIQTAKLEADQQVEMAVQNERVNRASVAFLLGVRGSVAPFHAESTTLKFSVPGKLGGTTQEALVQKAMANRPDVKIATLQIERAEASVDLARRYRYPDIALSLQYSQIGTGNNALSPPTVTFGVSLPLPLFYNQGGEIKRAQADYGAQTILKKKSEASAVSDVVQAWASFEASKATVERMESGGLLESAKKARDITQIQYNGGQTTLLDYLDATRTYIGVNVEYVNDRLAYWTAVFQLEAAVGLELRS